MRIILTIILTLLALAYAIDPPVWPAQFTLKFN